MGLTHYWQRGTELPAQAFAAAVADCQQVAEHTGVLLAGFEGTGKPVFEAVAIVFNGVKPAAVEPFEIHQTQFDRHGRPLVRSYCKTEGAAYDVCVRCDLIVLKHHLGDAISVDSDDDDAGWHEARQVCQRHLGYGNEFRLATR